MQFQSMSFVNLARKGLAIFSFFTNKTNKTYAKILLNYCPKVRGKRIIQVDTLDIQRPFGIAV